MYDLLIANGTVVDGTGGDRFFGDIAVKDGKIVDVARREPGASPSEAAAGPDASVNGSAAAREVMDARGMVVTPGFVDVHTHYDGQVTWDDLLEPSSQHGVTTVVMGNCGVGFAPVRPGKEDWLIGLMEGVEDIPGAALSEGITWGWETFPEYLDVLDDRKLAIDVGTQIAHGSVRGYVMGDRGAKNEPANSDDIREMSDIVREAIEAGALGVSTSRTIGHRAIDGEPVPGTFAAEDELFGLGRGLAAGGGGVFELAPAGAAGLDLIAPPKEMSWMRRLSAEVGCPVTFALLEVQAQPDLWRDMMEESLRALDEGAQVFPQVAARPFGLLVGLQTHHIFAKRPTYISLADLPVEERVARMLDPKVKAQILGEEDLPADPAQLFDSMGSMIMEQLGKIYVLGDPPNYEPDSSQTVAAVAEAAGVSPVEMAYDLFCEQDGHALLLLPLFNYFHGNHDVIREQLTHPQSVSGLSDGGAHCGMICDASIPTYMITHWTRDRTRGEQLPLEWVVRKQTHDTAELFGLGDRGTLEVGKRADINVIDHDRLTLRAPRMAYDLPASGRRLLQDTEGYVATVAGGEVVRRNGVDTGARPGGLIRGRR